MTEFPPGTIFTTRGKHPRICQVVDILKTYNLAGDLISTKYVCSHDMLGQRVLERDVVWTTIAMGSPVLPEVNQ